MATMTKRCSVCPTTIPSASIFCSKECQNVARVLRNSQPSGEEPHDIADAISVSEMINDELAERLRAAGAQHRTDVSIILAAYQHRQLELDSLIWAAHTHGMDDRTIGLALDMRTSSVRRRVLAFQSRLFGPVGGVSTSVAG